MPRSSDAKSRLIETAVTLFRRHGYNGIGLTDILHAAGAPKGSFYHHFPAGKEELAEAAVDLAARRIGRMVDDVFARESSLDGAFAAIALRIGTSFAESDYREGCPVTAIVIDAVPQSERLAAATERAINGWLETVERHGVRLGEADAKPRAERFFIALEGAWVVARVKRSPEPFLMAARMAAHA